MDDTITGDCDGDRRASMRWQFAMKVNLSLGRERGLKRMNLVWLMVGEESDDSSAGDERGANVNGVSWHVTGRGGVSSDASDGKMKTTNAFDLLFRR